MTGYLTRSSDPQPEEVFTDDGFFRTGDVGSYDKERQVLTLASPHTQRRIMNCQLRGNNNEV